MPTVSRLTAVVLPLVVLATAAFGLTREPAGETPKTAQAIDDALANNHPGIVVVGNSKARTDIDAPALVRALGYNRGIAAAKLDGSSAPGWYTILEQRVFGKGYTPELVIVYGQLGALLRSEASIESERRTIRELMDGPSPVIEARILGDTTGFGARARRGATALHDTIQSTLRDTFVGLLLAPDRSAGLRAAGEAVSQPALSRLFGKDARLVHGGATRVVPVAEQEKSLPMSLGKSQPDDWFLADLDTLVRAHGAKLLFVRAPLPPASADLDLVPAETEREALAVINRLGDSWIDLSTLPLATKDFADDFHAGPSGRNTITAALAEAIRTHDVLGGGVIEAQAPIIPDSVARVGALPPVPEATWLPQIGRACAWQAKWKDLSFLADESLFPAGIPVASPLVLLEHGEPLEPHATGKAWGETCAGTWVHHKNGPLVSPKTDPSGLTFAWTAELTAPDPDGDPVYWVYPGTAIEWKFTTAPEGPLTIKAEARAAKGGDATISVNGQEVPFVADGRQLRATLEAGVVSGAWTLSVRAGPDTWLVLDDLAYGSETLRALVASPRLAVNPLFIKRKPDPPPPPITVGPQGTSGPLLTFAVPGLGALSDDTLNARLGRKCSPVRADRAGTSGFPHQTKRALEAPDRGYGHWGDLLLVSPSASPTPVTVGLDPARKCASSLWVYPGDTLKWGLMPNRTGRMRLAPDLLVVEGSAFGEGASQTITFVVETLGQKGHRESVQVALPTSGAPVRQCLHLANPPAVGGLINLEATAPAGAWFLLDRLDFADTEHAEGCDG